MPKNDLPKIKFKNFQKEGGLSLLRLKIKDKGMKFAVGYCLDFPQLHCIDIPIIGNFIGQKRWISQILYITVFFFRFTGPRVCILILHKQGSSVLISENSVVILK